MFENYFSEIKYFLENKFEELDIEIPNYVNFNNISYAFGKSCIYKCNKSIEEQFFNFFYDENSNINWNDIENKSHYIINVD